MTLTDDEVRRVLEWAAATDFESKLQAEDVRLIERLADSVGENPHDYCEVFMSTRGHEEQ